MKLSEETVKDAACPADRKDKLLFDETLPGFGVRVTAAGRRTFIFQYRVGAKVRRAVLGEWGKELTVAQARRKAEVLRGNVRDRRDPVAERNADRVARLAAEAADRATSARAAFTVDVLISQWTEHHLSARSTSYRLRVPRELRAALSGLLGAAASALSHEDATRVLDSVKIGSGPVAANRLRAEARACWTWAVRRRVVAENPWADTPRPLAREVSRERVLTDQELGALYTAAGAVTEPFGAVVRLLLLTGQRRGEVAGMRWDELDLETALWSMPGERTKNHQAHVVPLAPAAVDLVRSMRRRRDAEFVFEGVRQTAVSGFGKIKARLDAALKSAAAEANRAAPAQWVLHDIRRTVATGMQRLGVRLEVTEAVLNHVSGSRSGIVGIYQRHGWANEKRAALEAWAQHVLTVAKGEAARGGTNVEYA